MHNVCTPSENSRKNLSRILHLGHMYFVYRMHNSRPDRGRNSRSQKRMENRS